MNAPPTFESFLLYDGEKKITREQDTKVELKLFYYMLYNSPLRCPMLLYSRSIRRITPWATWSGSSCSRTRMSCLLATRILTLLSTRYPVTRISLHWNIAAFLLLRLCWESRPPLTTPPMTHLWTPSQTSYLNSLSLRSAQATFLK